ncbi:MAG: hypothetical protein U0893_25020 [Chloroflexota bacterium]
MSQPTSPSADCPSCNAPASRIYSLPTHRARGRRVAAACYFCYIRITGIKPTRSRLVALGRDELLADGSDGAAD